MSAEPVRYITDPDDFCRMCRGSGLGPRETINHGQPPVQTICWQCGGSGKRAVRITPANSEQEET